MSWAGRRGQAKTPRIALVLRVTSVTRRDRQLFQAKPAQVVNNVALWIKCVAFGQHVLLSLHRLEKGINPSLWWPLLGLINGDTTGYHLREPDEPLACVAEPHAFIGVLCVVSTPGRWLQNELLCHANQRPIHFFTAGVSRVRL